MKALSIRQPWAHAIINYGHFGKDVENRKWLTKHRGRVLIHAGSTVNRREYDLFDWVAKDAGIEIDWPKLNDELRFGGVIGSVDLLDCAHVESARARRRGYDKSPWAFGPYLWILRNPEPMEFLPLSGQINLFEVDVGRERLGYETRRVRQVLRAYQESGSCATAEHARIKETVANAELLLKADHPQDLMENAAKKLSEIGL